MTPNRNYFATDGQLVLHGVEPLVGQMTVLFKCVLPDHYGVNSHEAFCLTRGRVCQLSFVLSLSLSIRQIL
jgi:hypothetical protein